MLWILIVLVCFANGEKLDLDRDVGPVVYLSMMYRHGDRTPLLTSLEKFPNDTNLKKENFPEGWEQLTFIGKRQHYKLGKWLRHRYIHLLPNGRYNMDTVCAKSTATDRTLDSAMTNLAGMFPPSTKQRFIPGLNWQPIPVRYSPAKQDKLIMMDAPCKKYDELVKELDMSPSGLEIKKRFQPLFDKVGLKYVNVNSIYDLQELYNLLLIEEDRNLEIDDIYKDVYPEQLKEASDFSFGLPTYTDPMKRLKSGPVIHEIIDNMEKSSKGLLVDSCVNITSYSAHDDITSNLMNTIGVFNHKYPPYGSLFLIELRQKDNQFFVTTLFKNTTDSSEPYLFPIPGCEEPCKLTTFKVLMEPFIPDDWEQECNM